MRSARSIVLAVFVSLLLPLSLWAAGPLTFANDAQFLESLRLSTAQPAAKASGLPAKSICSADCQGAGTASCSGSTCEAIDRNCSAGQRGYARCGSSFFYCNDCPGGGSGGGDCQSQCEITCGGPGFGFCINDICNCV